MPDKAASNDRKVVSITLDVESVFRAHLCVIGLLGAMYALLNTIAIVFDKPRQLGLRALFDLDGDYSVPGFFSAAALLIASGLAVLASQHTPARESRIRLGWRLMGIIMAFLAFDEMFTIHESIGRATRIGYDLPGGFHYGWVIPYVVLMAVAGVIFILFLRQLPHTTCRALLVAGAVFVAGAVGLEVLGGYVAARHPDDTTLLLVEVFFEETAEMVGVALFNRATLNYLADLAGGPESRLVD